MTDQANTTAAAPAKKEGAKAKLHTVVGRLFHNGKFHKKGSQISLTPAEAKPLGAAVIPVVSDEEAK